MSEVRSGFQKLVGNGCTPRRRRGPGRGGRLKEEGVLTAMSVTPVPVFSNLKFPPTTTNDSDGQHRPLPKFSVHHTALHHALIEVECSGSTGLNAVRQMNSALS